MPADAVVILHHQLSHLVTHTVTVEKFCGCSILRWWQIKLSTQAVLNQADLAAESCQQRVTLCVSSMLHLLSAVCHTYCEHCVTLDASSVSHCGQHNTKALYG